MKDQDIKQIGDQETQQAELVRLPLWKTCAERMLAAGIEHGKTYSSEFFEEQLKCSRDDMKFGLAVSEIRRLLETKGYYLSGRGLKGDSFVVLPPANHVDVLNSYAHAALDALKRGVILGTNTRLDLLNKEERRKHVAATEKMALRLLWAKKPREVAHAMSKVKRTSLEIKDVAS